MRFHMERGGGAEGGNGQGIGESTTGIIVRKEFHTLKGDIMAEGSRLKYTLIEVATKCIGSIDYWESLTNRIHGSFSSRSTMRVLVDP